MSATALPIISTSPTRSSLSPALICNTASSVTTFLSIILDPKAIRITRLGPARQHQTRERGISVAINIYPSLLDIHEDGGCMIFPSNHHRADEAQKSWQHRKSECTGSVVLCLCVQSRGRVEVFHGGAEENAGTKEPQLIRGISR